MKHTLRLGMCLVLPKGNAFVTDNILLTKLEQFERPVTIKDLSFRLDWSRGKIDGAVNRLQNKRKVAVIKISSPKGQRLRYIGLPKKSYWESFFQEIVVKQKNILANDPLGVLQPFTTQMGHSDTLQIEHLQQKLDELQWKLREKDQRLEYLEQQASEGHVKIDPSLVKVIDKYLDLISSAANQRGVSPAELLETAIPQIADPNFDLLTRIVSIVMSESQRETDSIARDVARSFLRRARSLDRVRGE